jgi:hypothetical protein
MLFQKYDCKWSSYDDELDLLRQSEEFTDCERFYSYDFDKLDQQQEYRCVWIVNEHDLDELLVYADCLFD